MLRTFVVQIEETRMLILNIVSANFDLIEDDVSKEQIILIVD